MEIIKVSNRFVKSLKDNRKYKGLEKVLRLKIREVEKYFELSHKIIRNDSQWCIKKLDATSMFGAYRIIVAKSADSKKVVYDFYFKNSREDMSNNELQELLHFITLCQTQDFYDGLADFDLEN
jgi:hypothetical protein